MSTDRGLRVGPLVVPLVVAGIVPTSLGLVLPGPAVALPRTAALPAGVALALLGAWMTAYAVDRVYLRQPTPLGDRPPEHLVTNGWYGIVRNPMAAGMTVLLAGEALLWSAFAVLLWAAVVLTVSYAAAKRVEEPSLLRTFGDEYARYRRSVPAWVPTLRTGRGRTSPRPPHRLP